jgi:molecular chaperone DnaK
MAGHNKTLGRFHLDGIPSAPRGVPQIEVTFDIDANGIVHVSAKDLGTGREQRITITASSGLAKDEVDGMVREAEAHASEDRKAREAAEARNRADQLVYQTERTLKDNFDKIPDADRQTARDAIDAAKKALEAGEEAGIRDASDRLERAAHRLAEAIYRSTQAGASESAGSGGEGEGSGSRDDVIDAEVVDADGTQGKRS